MRKALKLALEALETCCAGDYSTGHVIDPSFDEDAVNEAITAIKEALVQPEPPPECKTEEEKTAFAFGWWKALETQRMAQPDYRAVKTYHEGKPVYVSQPEQEPVGWQYREANDDGTWRAWSGCDKRLAEDHWRQVRAIYTAPPKRPWVGLTDEEIENGMCMSIQKTCRAIEATLKEKNT